MSELVWPSSSATLANPVASRMSLARAISMPKGHRLRVSVRESFVGGVGEEQFSPVHRQRGERLAAQSELFRDLVAQQPAQAGADAGQLLGAARRNGVPPEEPFEQGQQFWRCHELASR